MAKCLDSKKHTTSNVLQEALRSSNGGDSQKDLDEWNRIARQNHKPEVVTLQFPKYIFSESQRQREINEWNKKAHEQHMAPVVDFTMALGGVFGGISGGIIGALTGMNFGLDIGTISLISGALIGGILFARLARKQALSE